MNLTDEIGDKSWTGDIKPWTGNEVVDDVVSLPTGMDPLVGTIASFRNPEEPRIFYAMEPEDHDDLCRQKPDWTRGIVVSKRIPGWVHVRITKV